MPPFVAAAEILASPVANTRIPQASDLPTLEPVAAGPADTGPFILMVTGANTGPLPMAHPANTTAQDIASTRRFNMYVLPHLAHWPASYTRTRRASLRDPIDNRSSAQAVLRSAFLTARLAFRRREVSSSLFRAANCSPSSSSRSPTHPRRAEKSHVLPRSRDEPRQPAVP